MSNVEFSQLNNDRVIKINFREQEPVCAQFVVKGKCISHDHCDRLLCHKVHITWLGSEFDIFSGWIGAVWNNRGSEAYLFDLKYQQPYGLHRRSPPSDENWKHSFFTRVFWTTSCQFTVSYYVLCLYPIDCVKCSCSVLRDSVT